MGARNKTPKLARLLLKPVIAFCLRHSLKLRDVLGIIKELYVEVAEEQMRRQKISPTISRLSVMTGVHRRDISSLKRDAVPISRLDDLTYRVIGEWETGKRFRDAQGKPRVLRASGKQSEFVELVRSVSRDLNPYTVLFELKRTNAVKRTKGGLKLQSAVYIPLSIQDGVALLGKDIEDLIAAVEENLYSQPQVPNLHIKSQYDNVQVESLPQIRRWLLEEGTAFQKKVRQYLSKFDLDLNPQKGVVSGKSRVAFGTFSYTMLPEQGEDI